jgi:hypothetical protein
LALKKRKGFSIESKSLRCKLLRNGIDLTETKTAFNEIVEFYYYLINTDPTGIDIPVTENGGWRFYELLTIGEDAQYPLPFDCPVQFRRSAIRKAIGAYRSWRPNYERWLKRSKRHKHHRPPVPSRHFNFSPSFDAGIWKEDTGVTILLKIRRNRQWLWVKFSYQGYSISSEWVKGSPTVVLKGNTAYLTFSVERYVAATGGIKNVMAQDSVRVLSVDIDLDKNAAICSVLETDAKGYTVEVARHFIKQPSLVKRRKRDLGQIAKRMRATGITHKGFCKKWWVRLHNREVEMGRAIARQIVDLAHGYGCQVIAFEHLGNLIPSKGKYSKRSNQKRAYWLKSKIYHGVKRIAYQDYAILTTRVNPRNTSRFDPWGNQVWRGSTFPDNLVDYLGYQPGADWVAGVNGYAAHSGLNAARNIGMKAIVRHKFEAVFSKQLTLNAMPRNTADRKA